MIRINFFLIVFTAYMLFFSCGKSNENATAEKNLEAQLTETPNITEDSRDENGWYHDWNQGIAAKKEKKTVLVDFYTDWCRWCKVMDEETFSDPEIKKIFASDWITIKINAEDKETSGIFKDRTMSYRQLTGVFGVSGFPSYVFIDKKGEPVTVIPGYFPKEKFSRILDYMKNELYLKEVNLQEFVESKS